MNRLEIALLLLLAFIGVILTIRSRWFDRLIDWAFRAKPTTPPSNPPSDTPST
jgi:hypothetical protein